MPLSNLPPQIRSQILALSPGQVTPPISITNGIVLFQLRGIEETDAPEATDVSLEYAAYYIPGGRSEAALKEAARIKGRVDSCDDLYGIAKGQPEEVLDIDTLPIADVPQDVAIELAKLDAGEVSTNLTRANGQTLVLLMLCGRTAELGEDVSREDVRGRLFNQRLESYANGYLSELKADATIVYP
jgi:peptidyl-prolyl cis-trans isomerase SurA